jgi:hypothetical protein
LVIINCCFNNVSNRPRDVLFSTTNCNLLRLIVWSVLGISTFATRCLHTCHHARAPSGGRWNCGREMCGKFCLNAELHVTARNLLHAVKLRHGTDGFTSPPKKGVLTIFSPKKSEGFGRELGYQRPARYLHTADHVIYDFEYHNVLLRHKIPHWMRAFSSSRLYDGTHTHHTR